MVIYGHFYRSYFASREVKYDIFFCKKKWLILLIYSFLTTVTIFSPFTATDVNLICQADKIDNLDPGKFNHRYILPLYKVQVTGLWRRQDTNSHLSPNHKTF